MGISPVSQGFAGRPAPPWACCPEPHLGLQSPPSPAHDGPDWAVLAEPVPHIMPGSFPVPRVAIGRARWAHAADEELPPVRDSRAATEGGPYTAFVGAALRGGPACASPKHEWVLFCRSPKCDSSGHYHNFRRASRPRPGTPGNVADGAGGSGFPFQSPARSVGLIPSRGR